MQIKTLLNSYFQERAKLRRLLWVLIIKGKDVDFVLLFFKLMRKLSGLLIIFLRLSWGRMLLGLILIQDINKEDKKEEEEMEIKKEMIFAIDMKMKDRETNTMIDTMIDIMRGTIIKGTETMEESEIDTAEDSKMMIKDTIDKEVQGILTDLNRR